MLSSCNQERTVVIIGGGLSGLVTARELIRLCQDGTDCPFSKIIILEARNRFGGRIHNEHGVDLGATWTWPGHDKALNQLTNELAVYREEQYVTGKALIQRADGRVVPFAENESPAGERSMRFKGGTSVIISSLVSELQQSERVELITNIAVRSVSQSIALDGSICCTVDTFNPRTELDTTTSITSIAVVAALPLQLLAKTILFQPQIPSQQLSLMVNTPTWMGTTGKVAFVYNKPFWKDLGLSGTLFSESGPMSQVWDASSADGQTYALCSFVFGEALEALRDPMDALTSKNSHLPVLKHLIEIFGPEAASPNKIVFKAWDVDKYTMPSTPVNYSGCHTPLGHPVATRPHINVIFSGTESCPNENGHMNGAVLAGIKAARDVLLLLLKKHGG